VPIDIAQLGEALKSVQAVYDPTTTSVRTGKVIEPLHEYCAYELRRAKYKDNQLPLGFIYPAPPATPAQAKKRIRGAMAKPPKRLRILGAYMPKEVDVALIPPNSGPLLAVSCKSQMSSIVKNTINRFEEYVGDATNLHTRFPMLVFGFLMLVPAVAETWSGSAPTDGLKRIAALLERSNARQKSDEPPGGYDASALLFVDFKKTPPRIMPYPDPKTQPMLRIESFFDRLVQLYFERNQFV
jgi:hypothetical protein